MDGRLGESVARVLNDAKGKRYRAGWGALAGSGVIIAFWVQYWATGSGAGATPAIAAFESAFPIADLLLAATLAAAGIGLLRGARIGPFLLLAAGGALFFLAVIDVTFFFRHHLYFPITITSALEVLVNLLCFGGGIYALRYGWSTIVRPPREGP